MNCHSFYILSVLFIFINISEALPLTTEDREEIALQCIAETKVDKSVVEIAKATLVLPSDQKYKDFLFCSYKKQGFQNPDGTMVYSELRKFLLTFETPKDTELLIGNCMNTGGKTPSDVSFNTLRCLLGNLFSTREMAADDINTNEIKDDNQIKENHELTLTQKIKEKHDKYYANSIENEVDNTIEF